MRKINIKELCTMYGLTRSTFDNYVRAHKEELSKLAIKYKNNKGKIVDSRYYNQEQLHYIVYNILKDENPIGFKFDGKSFVKIN